MLSQSRCLHRVPQVPHDRVASDPGSMTIAIAGNQPSLMPDPGCPVGHADETASVRGDHWGPPPGATRPYRATRSGTSDRSNDRPKRPAISLMTDGSGTLPAAATASASSTKYFSKPAGLMISIMRAGVLPAFQLEWSSPRGLTM